MIGQIKGKVEWKVERKERDKDEKIEEGEDTEQEEEEKNTQCRQGFRHPEKEPETNKTLTSYDRAKLVMEANSKN